MLRLLPFSKHCGGLPSHTPLGSLPSRLMLILLASLLALPAFSFAAGSLTITGNSFDIINSSFQGYGGTITIINTTSGNSITYYIASYPSITKTLQISGCGAGNNQQYTPNNNVSITALAPACSAYVRNPLKATLSPGSNTFTYQDSVSGANISVNATGFKINALVNLSFTNNYSNPAYNITVNPPKLSSLNYYNTTLNLTYNQSLIDQQLFLTVRAPTAPKLNLVENVLPSWTQNITISNSLLNYTINLEKIPALGIVRLLGPGENYGNSTYGINFSAFNGSQIVYNYNLLQEGYEANEIKNCKKPYTPPNGIAICLDNLSLAQQGEIINSQNPYLGAGQVIQMVQSQCATNYTNEVELYNSTDRSYIGCQQNLTIANKDVANSQSLQVTYQNEWADALVIILVIGGIYYYAQRKRKQRV